MSRTLQSIALSLATTLGLATAPTAAAAATAAEPLELADRVACRTAVEDVYWRARLWPQANPGVKPPLSQVVSTGQIAAAVEESLALSMALEEHWGQPITGDMLQAELDRMAAGSRRPALLRELYAALDHDPLRLAECVARPALADRLARERFAADPRFAGSSFADWWAASRPATGAFATPSFDYSLPPVSAPAGAAEGWLDTASVPLDDVSGDVEGAAVWTGSEMVFLGDFDREAYRYDPATDTWRTASTLGGPLGLRDTTAVWTGTHVVASNGCTANNHLCTTRLAWRYDPQADLWERIPDAPITRTDQSAVWTGSEMLVWGGCTYLNDACQVYSQTGARYDPDSNTWQAMSSAGAPAGRTFPNLVWTGSQMLVWGGQAGGTASGGRYDPATDSWSGMSVAGAPTGTASTAVWSGEEMLVWGGCAGSPSCSPQGTGARYDPAGDAWSPIAATGAPAARLGHAAVWTGGEMLVWGGFDGGSHRGDGALYDPAADSWRPAGSAGAPTPRRDLQLLWTGSQALVWGGSGPGDMRTGGRYDPVGESWLAVRREDPDSLRTSHVAVWTGAEMIVWGGTGDGSASTSMATGRRYDPATDSWSATATAGAPPGARGGSAVWTGTELLVWGGQSGSVVRDTGGRYDPITDSWTAIAPGEGRTGHASAWTGTELLVWGGSTWTTPWTDTGARYDPVADAWSPMASAGAPSPRSVPGAAWSGGSMLVWGGYGPSGEVGSGGLYHPASDSWTPMSELGAPSPRYGHAVVWSGEEMIVWGGGESSSSAFFVDGGRYDPATDTWSPTSTVGTPLPAVGATAVWTGTEMIVWGGACDQAGQPTCHTDSYEGGRYDPVADAWTATTLEGVPEARSAHTAVWTGDAMIVWGGVGTWSGYRHTGGIYWTGGAGEAGELLFADGFEGGDPSGWVCADCA